MNDKVSGRVQRFSAAQQLSDFVGQDFSPEAIPSPNTQEVVASDEDSVFGVHIALDSQATNGTEIHSSVDQVSHDSQELIVDGSSNSLTDHSASAIHGVAVSEGLTSTGDQGVDDTQTIGVPGGPQSAESKLPASNQSIPDSALNLPGGQDAGDVHHHSAAGQPTFDSGQVSNDNHESLASVENTSSIDQTRIDSHRTNVGAGSTSSEPISTRMPKGARSGDSGSGSQGVLDTHQSSAAGSTSTGVEAITSASPKSSPPLSDGSTFAGDGARVPASPIAQSLPSGGTQSAESSQRSSNQIVCYSAPTSPSETNNAAVPRTLPSRSGSTKKSSTDQATIDTQGCDVRGGFLRDPVLGILADVVNDLEAVRIANANRVATLTRVGFDKDGEERGHGLTKDHPEVAKLILTVQAIAAAEKDSVKNMEKAMAKHALGPWVKKTTGIGLKQAARLLAVIGDPYFNDLHDRPRTVSELWAYTGLHVVQAGDHHSNGSQIRTVPSLDSQTHPSTQLTRDNHAVTGAGVAPKRTRGQRSNWNEEARKRTWLIASAIPKFKTSPYEPVYRQARVKYADSVHKVDCVRCGPKGKPALAGSPLSLGHQNARAIRIVAKEILKDLWRESKRLHEEAEATT